MNIYLVTWQHAKKTGIVGAYPTEEAAKKVLDLLINHGDLSKKFELITVQDGG